MVKSNLHGHTKQIGYPESCIRKRNRGDTGASVRGYAIRPAGRSSRAHEISLRISPMAAETDSSSTPAPTPTSCTLHRLSCRLSSPLTRRSSFPLLHAAKPIRDLKASVPINYHPNQCRGLWYRIICQIIAAGWGQVPPCQRPYPHGNFCSGWALPALPNLLMEVIVRSRAAVRLPAPLDC